MNFILLERSLKVTLDTSIKLQTQNEHSNISLLLVFRFVQIWKVPLLFPRHFSPKPQILSGFVVTARNVTVSCRQNIPAAVLQQQGWKHHRRTGDQGQPKLDTESFRAVVVLLGSWDPKGSLRVSRQLPTKQLLQPSTLRRRKKAVIQQHNEILVWVNYSGFPDVKAWKSKLKSNVWKETDLKLEPRW